MTDLTKQETALLTALLRVGDNSGEDAAKLADVACAFAELLNAPLLAEMRKQTALLKKMSDDFDCGGAAMTVTLPPAANAGNTSEILSKLFD